MSMSHIHQRIAGLYRSLGPRRAAALGAGILAVAALVVVAVATSSGGSKPGHGAAIARKQEAQQVTTAVAPQRRPGGNRGRRATVAKGHPRSRRAPTQARHSGAGGVPGSSGGGGAQPTGSASISLRLHGGGSATISACGVTHHYRTYAVGATVSFSGKVSPRPSGTWKVKVKIKVCTGGAFQDFTKIDAQRDKHHGTFSGTFPAPAAGLYAARAELYVNDSVVADSDKRHFASR